ncbi:hypothetical protein C8R47DRAFT_1064421 [Mycena vitilis]|nr:hypothetical protein C8R47DRAFT_1064421 [Mycena vitilis]
MRHAACLKAQRSCQKKKEEEEKGQKIRNANESSASSRTRASGVKSHMRGFSRQLDPFNPGFDSSRSFVEPVLSAVGCKEKVSKAKKKISVEMIEERYLESNEVLRVEITHAWRGEASCQTRSKTKREGREREKEIVLGEREQYLESNEGFRVEISHMLAPQGTRVQLLPTIEEACCVHFSECSFLGNHVQIAKYGSPATAGREFLTFFDLFGPQKLNVTVTDTKSVQFRRSRHASPEHSVKIVQ